VNGRDVEQTGGHLARAGSAFTPSPANVGPDWPVWRLVLHGISLTEIETRWQLEHVFDANEALDITDDMKAASRGG